MGEQIERATRSLDISRPELGKDDARRALAISYTTLAEDASPAFGSSLMLKASRLLSEELDDNSASFDILRQAMSRYPDNRDIYEAAQKAAIEIGHLSFPHSMPFGLRGKGPFEHGEVSGQQRGKGGMDVILPHRALEAFERLVRPPGR